MCNLLIAHTTTVSSCLDFSSASTLLKPPFGKAPYALPHIHIHVAIKFVPQQEHEHELSMLTDRNLKLMWQAQALQGELALSLDNYHPKATIDSGALRHARPVLAAHEV